MSNSDQKFKFDAHYTPAYETHLFQVSIKTQTDAIELLRDSGHILYKFAYNRVMITLIVAFGLIASSF
jgi:hypothetical protein